MSTLLTSIQRDCSVETGGGIFIPIAKKNSTLPLKQTRTFQTAEADQTRFVVRVFEGEQQFVKKNTLLASFEVPGLGEFPPSPETGTHDIDITVEVDENHYIKVYATHAPSNRNIGFELSDDVLMYDWSSQFVGGPPGTLKQTEQGVPWSPARCECSIRSKFRIATFSYRPERSLSVTQGVRGPSPSPDPPPPHQPSQCVP